MSRIIIYISIPILICFSLSCAKNTEAELSSYDLLLEETFASIDQKNKTINLSFPHNVKSAKDLCADFCISEKANAYVNNKLQISGVSPNNYEAPFIFTLVSQDELLSVSWEIKSVNNDYTLSWGMGGFLSEELSLNKTYNWYIDQSQTGIFSDFNCAPSCVVMASHWQSSHSEYTVEEARALYHPHGGGWLTEDTEGCLNDFNIEHITISLSDYRDETTQIILDNLNDGNILLLPIDLFYLEESANPEFKINKYYETLYPGTGHCIIIKGFKKVDNKIYFEIYDPIGYDYKYNDGSFKGQDRYYTSDDIYTAAFASWNYAFVILGPESKKTSERSVEISKTPSILIL